MSKMKNKAERKKTIIRIVSLTLAGLMIFSVLAAAILSQVF